MFAELQCVILHCLRDVLYTDPRLTAAVIPFLCGNYCSPPAMGSSLPPIQPILCIFLLHDVKAFFSKSSLDKRYHLSLMQY